MIQQQIGSFPSRIYDGKRPLINFIVPCLIER
jgi:hypothetical protein